MEAAVERTSLQLRREGWAPSQSSDSLRPGRNTSMGGPVVQQLVIYRLALSGPGSDLRFRAAATTLRRHERMVP
eukprot:15442479-Alexandrium_andersonii.AAC.1